VRTYGRRTGNKGGEDVPSDATHSIIHGTKLIKSGSMSVQFATLIFYCLSLGHPHSQVDDRGGEAFADPHLGHGAVPQSIRCHGKI